MSRNVLRVLCGVLAVFGFVGIVAMLGATLRAPSAPGSKQNLVCSPVVYLSFVEDEPPADRVVGSQEPYDGDWCEKMRERRLGWGAIAGMPTAVLGSLAFRWRDERREREDERELDDY